MFKILRFYATTTFILIFVLSSFSCVNNKSDFIELTEGACIILDQDDIQKLPPIWHKYKGFVKICKLKNKKTSDAEVGIVSVWARGYIEAHKQELWKDYPNAIIVDNHFNILLILPELFPSDSIAYTSIYYGKWKGNIPTEIRIDVADPTVTGDYYYAPVIWNAKDKKYYMKDREPKPGKRP